MTTVILIIHLMLASAMIVVILLQRSEGGALGIGGDGGVMSGRGAANLLTRTTSILAGLFFLTSILLGILARHGHEYRSIIPTNAPASAPAQSGGSGSGPLPQLKLPTLPNAAAPQSGAPAAPKAAAPAAPKAPAVPQSQ
jgi:preprotein translocase subunit SecG